MKIEEDGFKIIEPPDEISAALYAMNDNIILLHDRIKTLEEKYAAQ